MQFSISEETHIGYVRSLNQDSHFFRQTDKGTFLCVADGLGGHPCGEVASHLVTDIFQSRMETFFSNTDPHQAMNSALRHSQQQIKRYTHERPDCTNMGTTLVCARLQANHFFTAHIGDSRAYLIRQHSVCYRTEDHTLVQRLIHQGELPAEALHFHPYRHILDRIVGGDPESRPVFDFSPDLEILEGDYLLLCSDGLYGMVPESQMLHILQQATTDLQSKCNHLLQAALQNGGQDNITLIVLQGGTTNP